MKQKEYRRETGGEADASCKTNDIRWEQAQTGRDDVNEVLATIGGRNNSKRYWHTKAAIKG